ncbi:7-cyano-7-deazaguanine synthase [Edaphobacter sp.]|uniref:7-cyano-7-deazaguanine synthase n=1 Tax=Edaphobacter sp. TaxID=1934404 RepID=UPI002D7F8862|nr:7-cyano-7-deazaguanine synthase [Edaphobacter sp.]
MSEQRRRAVVLLSGGLDSTTVLAIAKAEGYETYALSFSYGHPRRSETCSRETTSACARSGATCFQ